MNLWIDCMNKLSTEFLSNKEAPTLQELSEYRSWLYETMKGNNGDVIRHFGSCVIEITQIIILVKHCNVRIEDKIRFHRENKRAFVIPKRK